MPKKSWLTVLIVVLIIAAVVAIYFLIRQPRAVAPTSNPVPEATQTAPATLINTPDLAETTPPAIP